MQYKKLNNSKVNSKCKDLFNSMQHPMFTEKIIITNKKYLLALSKFIDYKINNNKQTYRSKSNIILIEQIANILANDLIKTGECNLFCKFKQAQNKFKLRQKEIKIFKVLLAKNIFYQLFIIENELTQISNVIHKSKNAKSLKKYHKNILNSANYYGILKYNKNSTKLLNGKKNNISTVKNLFCELIEAEHRIKLSCAYLKVLFS